jgi:hypothetical protein
MTLSEIYKWIQDNFPFYRTPAAGTGWKVSQQEIQHKRRQYDTIPEKNGGKNEG